MPNSAQAEKRLRQDERRRMHNRGLASRMRTEVKRVETHLENGELDDAEKAISEAFKRIDKAAKCRLIHPNNANRKKSALSRSLNRKKQA